MNTVLQISAKKNNKAKILFKSREEGVQYKQAELLEKISLKNLQEILLKK
jgi:hypothetical protein